MGLKFLFGFKTNRSHGAGLATSIGELLSEDPPDFGEGLECIDLTMLHNGRVNTGAEGFMRQIGIDWLPTSFVSSASDFPPLNDPPRLRFERKRRRLSIDWVSERVLPDEVCGYFLKTLTTDFYERVFDDVIDALAWGFAERIKPSDQFDTEACLAWVRDIRGQKFESDKMLRARLERANAISKARYAAMDPWEKLDIDWSKYASNARDILDEPRDWFQGDEFSPHGNDTGADILAEWHVFRDLTPDTATWQLEMEVPTGPNDEFAWWHWVEVHLALAFGHIKKSGTCPKALRDGTLSVLQSERSAAESRRDWPYREAWLERIDRYVDILKAL